METTDPMDTPAAAATHGRPDETATHGRPATAAELATVDPYRLARRWLDLAGSGHPAVGGVDGALTDLAVTAALAAQLTRRLVVQAHQAILAGATADQAAAAAGLTVPELAERWHRWAARQRETIVAGRPLLATADYDRVAAALECPPRSAWLDQAEQHIAAARQHAASGDLLRRNRALDQLHHAQDALREAGDVNGRDGDRKAQLAAELREIRSNLGAPGSLTARQ